MRRPTSRASLGVQPRRLGGVPSGGTAWKASTNFEHSPCHTANDANSRVSRLSAGATCALLANVGPSRLIDLPECQRGLRTSSRAVNGTSRSTFAPRKALPMRASGAAECGLRLEPRPNDGPRRPPNPSPKLSAKAAPSGEAPHVAVRCSRTGGNHAKGAPAASESPISGVARSERGPLSSGKRVTERSSPTTVEREAPQVTVRCSRTGLKARGSTPGASESSITGVAPSARGDDPSRRKRRTSWGDSR